MTGRQELGLSCLDCRGGLVEDTDGGPRVQCQACGAVFHAAVIEHSEALERLAERDDQIGAIAERLLITGGIKNQDG